MFIKWLRPLFLFNIERTNMISLFWWGVIFAIVSLALTLILSGSIIPQIKFRKGIALAGLSINFMALLFCFGTGGELDKFGLGIVVVWFGIYLMVWLLGAIEKAREERK